MKWTSKTGTVHFAHSPYPSPYPLNPKPPRGASWYANALAGLGVGVLAGVLISALFLAVPAHGFPTKPMPKPPVIIIDVP